LVLAGSGLTAASAHRIATELSSGFTVLGPAATPTVPAAAAMLDAAKVGQAHVIGLSFGGVIAQQLAIRRPDRVRSLVLGSTSGGGALYVPPTPPVRSLLGELEVLPVEEGLWASVPYLYAPVTRRYEARRIGEDIERRLAMPLDARAYRRQRAAGRAHDAEHRLDRIKAPTLVVHGEHDRIVPAENGVRLAGAIADARLALLGGAGHAFPTDVGGAGEEVVSFVRRHSRARRAPAAPCTARAARA
jgi:pimeloyl-ACP methyl ester carboxylesterase